MLLIINLEECLPDVVQTSTLINSLDDLMKERRMNKSLNEELIKLKKGSQNINSE
jgi:hypothetical protein